MSPDTMTLATMASSPETSIVPHLGPLPGGPAPESAPAEAPTVWRPVSYRDSRARGSNGSAHSSGGNGNGTAHAPKHYAYEMKAFLGRGGMGEVWEAVQPSLERKVAVKRVRKGRHGEEESEERERMFRHEALIAARLEHPNIVPVHDLGEDADGTPLMAMKLVRGEPWDQILHRDLKELEQGALAEEDFLARHLPVLVAMGQAVAFAHEQGIVHRDLKPAQVMVGRFGEVLLMDWGLAIVVDSPTAEDDLRSDIERLGLNTPQNASSPAGTPALMAPEQTRNQASEIGFHTDVYLLGGTLYYMLTGTYPHAARSSEIALAKAAIGEVERPSARAPQRRIPQDLEDLCMAALEADPEKRLRTAKGFVEGITDFLSGSSKRRESMLVAAEAEAAIARGLESYTQCTEVLARLRDAERLWPGNGRVPVLLEEVTQRYAELALDRGDLALAQLQAEALPEAGERPALLGKVETARRGVRRRRMMLRASALAIVTLAAAIALVSLVFTNRLNEKALALQQQTEIAEQQRAAAEEGRATAQRNEAIAMERMAGATELASYMLKDLRDSLDLRNEGDKRIAAAVAQGAAEYYAGIQADDYPEEIRFRHADQLIDVAGQFRELGLYAEALDAAREAERLLTTVNLPVDETRSRAYNEVGLTLRQLGKFEEALDAHLTGAEMLERSGRASARAVYAIYTNLSALHHHMGQYQMALDYIEKAGAILPDLTEKSVTDEIGNMKDRGIVLVDLGRPQEGFALQEKAAALTLEHYDTDPKEMRVFAVNLVPGLLIGRKVELAQALSKKALDTALVFHGPDSPEAAQALSLMADCARATNDLVATVEYARRHYFTARKAYGPESFEALDTARALAALFNQSAQYLDIAETVEEVRREYYHIPPIAPPVPLPASGRVWDPLVDLELRMVTAANAAKGPSDPHTVSATMNVVNTYSRFGAFEEAQRLVRDLRETILADQNLSDAERYRSLDFLLTAMVTAEMNREGLQVAEDVRAMAAKMPGSKAEEAKALMTIGAIRMKLDDLSGAEEAVLHARRIFEDEGLTDTSDYRTLLSFLGAFYQNTAGDLELAEKYVRASIEHGDRTGANTSDLFAHWCNNLAAIIRDRGRPQEAEQWYLRAIAIMERRDGPESIGAVEHLSNLGTLYRDLGQFDKAREALGRVIRIREQFMGPEHEDSATARLSFATLLWREGKLEDARDMMQDALAKLRKRLPENHRNVQTAVQRLAGIEADLAKRQEP